MRFNSLCTVVRFAFISPFVKLNDKKIVMDIERWKKQLNIQKDNKKALAILLFNFKEFRNLFLYRNSNRPIFRKWVKLWYKPLDSLYIKAKEIGGGLFILHGFSTIISAEYIGENCWITQQVTVGYNGKGKPPYIGNGVTIACGAKVLGNIKIGDHATVGANAVVVKDVEPNTVVGGVPAKFIKYRDDL